LFIFSLKVTRVTSYHLYYVLRRPTACAQNVRLKHECKRVDLDATSPTAHSITVWLRVAHWLLMRLFSSSTSEILVR